MVAILLWENVTPTAEIDLGEPLQKHDYLIEFENLLGTIAVITIPFRAEEPPDHIRVFQINFDEEHYFITAVLYYHIFANCFVKGDPKVVDLVDLYCKLPGKVAEVIRAVDAVEAQQQTPSVPIRGDEFLGKDPVLRGKRRKIRRAAFCLLVIFLHSKFANYAYIALEVLRGMEVIFRWAIHDVTLLLKAVIGRHTDFQNNDAVKYLVKDILAAYNEYESPKLPLSSVKNRIVSEPFKRGLNHYGDEYITPVIKAFEEQGPGKHIDYRFAEGALRGLHVIVFKGFLCSLLLGADKVSALINGMKCMPKLKEIEKVLLKHSQPPPYQ